MSKVDSRVKRAEAAAGAAIMTVLGKQRWPERLLYLSAGALWWWGFTGTAWHGAAAFIFLGISFFGLAGWSVVMYGAGYAGAHTELMSEIKAKVAAGEMCSSPNHVPVAGGGCLCGLSYTEPVQ